MILGFLAMLMMFGACFAIASHFGGSSSAKTMMNLVAFLFVFVGNLAIVLCSGHALVFFKSFIRIKQEDRQTVKSLAYAGYVLSFVIFILGILSALMAVTQGKGLRSSSNEPENVGYFALTCVIYSFIAGFGWMLIKVQCEKEEKPLYKIKPPAPEQPEVKETV
jgi:protein-S-isoprenylcysteine O-methyltransferase Ste14